MRWLNSLRQRFVARRSLSKRAVKRKAPIRLAVKGLEERIAPATDLLPISATATNWIHINWTALAGSHDYHLYRSTDPNDFYRSTDLNDLQNRYQIYHGPATDDIDTNRSSPHLVAGTTYYYAVSVDNEPTLSQVRSGLLCTPEEGSIAPINGCVSIDYAYGYLPITYHVTIENLTGGGIDPNKPTWLVIHGLNEQPSDLYKVGNAIAQARPGEQVLFLNWFNVTRIGGTGAGATANDWIPVVAEWGAVALRDWRFSNFASNLNLVGHSWGSYVAADIGQQLGHVNTIIAIDPGINGSGNLYNPDVPGTINFSANSGFSWAFHSPQPSIFFGIVAGSVITPPTASEAYVMPGVDHSSIVDAVADLIAGHNDVSQRFTLDRLLRHQYYPYLIPNKFNADGSYSSGSTNPYEAVFGTDGQHQIQTVVFFNSGTPNAREPIIRYANQGLSVTDFQFSGSSSGISSASQSLGAATSAANPGASAHDILVQNAVSNFGSTASAPATAVFYTSDNPEVHGAEFTLGSRAIETLANNNVSKASTSLSLASLPSGVLTGGQVFLAIAINPSGTPNASDLDWLQIPMDPSGFKPDLVGTYLDVEPRPTTYGWGQTVTVNYRFTNQAQVTLTGRSPTAFTCPGAPRWMEAPSC